MIILPTMRGVLGKGSTRDNVALPSMTSNSLPAGYTAASSNAQASYAAWKAFNGSWNGAANDLVSSAVPTVPWTLDRGLPVAKKVYSYRLVQHSGPENDNWNDLGSPTEWSIRGSNDGTNWTEIDTRTNQPISFGSSILYEVASPGSYSIYRMQVTRAGAGGTSPSYIIIGELIYYT